MMETLNSSSVVEMFADTSETHQMTDVLLSDELTVIFQYLLFTFLCQIISSMGIISNIINIVCFVKQGFNDTVNVSLLGLAVADLGCLTTIFVGIVFMTPALEDADLPFYPAEVMYLTTAVLHFTFSRISSWITALITLERCLCICLPLQISGFLGYFGLAMSTSLCSILSTVLEW